MNLAHIAKRLQDDGEPVSFVAVGRSMEPKVSSGDVVIVEPLVRDPAKGDIVLAKVNGHWYLHLVTAIHKGQAQISNNKGHVNGWTAIHNVVGILK